MVMTYEAGTTPNPAAILHHHHHDTQAVRRPSISAEPSAIVERYLPDLSPFEHVYKDIHRNPELGTQEVWTTYPVTNNTPAVVDAITETWTHFFGDMVWDMGQDTASEDISVLATSIGRPYAYWYIGSTEAALWDHANEQGTLTELVPGTHSSYFAPVIQPTLMTAVDAMALATLTFLT